MAYRICSSCGKNPAQPGQSYCKDCHADYMRSWRSKSLSIRLADDIYEWARRRSGRTGQNMSAIVNEALRLLRDTDDGAIERGITRMIKKQQPGDDGDVSRETKRA